jgi:hypothetical protein
MRDNIGAEEANNQYNSTSRTIEIICFRPTLISYLHSRHNVTKAKAGMSIAALNCAGADGSPCVSEGARGMGLVSMLLSTCVTASLPLTSLIQAPMITSCECSCCHLLMTTRHSRLVVGLTRIPAQNKRRDSQLVGELRYSSYHIYCCILLMHGQKCNLKSFDM